MNAPPTVPLPPPKTFKLDLQLEVGIHPKDCVMAVEYMVKHLCKATNKDPAEATMMLLTAAVHMAVAYSKGSTQDTVQSLGTALAHAVGASMEFFPPKDFKKTILHS